MASAVVVVLACFLAACTSLPSSKPVAGLWPNNQVYYTIDKEVFSEKALAFWDRVFQDVEENTCINIKERKAEPGYVKIEKQNVESSHASAGYQGDIKHILVIITDDPSRPDITHEYDHLFYHEFMHVLGLDHEHFMDCDGDGRCYNWPKAFGILREMYNCTGTYPRKMPKRPGSITTPKPTCFDRADDCQSSIDNPKRGREFVCNGKSWWAKEGMCHKSCGNCKE